MLIESFSQSILRWLRIPPGSSVRKSSGVSTSSSLDIENNDYVNVILDITVDDICIGDAPLSIAYNQKTSKAAALKLEQICEEFNTVVKDIARDLCQYGFSVYDVEIDKEDNRILLFPYTEDVDFYISNKKKIVLYKKDSKEQLKNKLIYLNYNKRCLEKVEDNIGDSDVRFRVNPEPMQMKNVDKTLEGIVNAETAISKYRGLLRPVRVANVDIGISQGNTQKDVVDTIASSINCNSSSLGNGTTYTDFDDNIPVLPNRKGLGKVELSSDIPSADIKEMADMEYWLNKLNLITRFPGTYMDFSKALSESAVSMIRGDLRYVKLCKAVQSKIVVTTNKFIQESKFSKYEPVVSLTTYPSSEDDDVMSALQDYCDLAKDVDEYVLGDPEDGADLRLHRLQLIEDLFATSTTSPMLQKWFDDFEEYINGSSASEEDEEGEMEGEDFSSEDFSAGEEDFSEGTDLGDTGGDLEIPEESSEDVEILEPQSV